MSVESNVPEVAEDGIPSGSVPRFGEPQHDPEAAANHLVLSASESHHLAGLAGLKAFAGEFSMDHPALRGTIDVFPTAVVGLVHVHADVQLEPAGAIFFDAEVRASWLATAAGEDLHGASARVIRALAELARIPHQRTVQVGFRES